MSHPIPEDAQRLADRLRMAADEIESAARYGVPIPSGVTVDCYPVGGLHLSALHGEYDAWVDYFQPHTIDEYDHDGWDWSRATADVNGLPVRFAVRHEPRVPKLAVQP